MQNEVIYTTNADLPFVSNTVTLYRHIALARVPGHNYCNAMR